MNPRSLLIKAFLSLSLSLATAPAHAVIERVEPPFWWTGFRNTELQLMVYGEKIADYEPRLESREVRLLRTERVDSPNYLFLYLDVPASAVSGTFRILFENGAEELSHEYHLREKNPDPNHAQGFGRSDAIYLITPDRFANGNPGNDNIDGMPDRLNRANKDGRHGGDIRGISDSLDYIQDMGFTAIWLNPVLENDMPEFSYHGYAATDFYRVDPRYGSNEEYRDLVQKARGMGIGTIMDMIVNHAGGEHWWLDDLPTADWINQADDPQVTIHQRYTNQDPYASEADRRAHADGWFVVPQMPDLNQRNPLLGDYLVQNALWWIEYLGLAGIRMDTWPYPDKHYMAEWTRRVMTEYPQFNIVGEEWSAAPQIVSYWQKGQTNLDGYSCDLPSLMDFPIQEAVWLGLTTTDDDRLFDNSAGGLHRMYRMLAMDFLYPDAPGLVTFPDNHDMDRIFTQLDEDYDLWRMAMAYYTTMRGIPQFYYGTEILMDSTEDSSHGYIRSDFPGGWTGDPVDAFSGEGLSAREREAQAYLRKLLNWRRDKAVLHDGKTMQFLPENARYVYFRYDEQDSVMVAFNKQGKQQLLELDRFQERLSGYRTARDVITGEQLELSETLLLPPRSVRVLELRK